MIDLDPKHIWLGVMGALGSLAAMASRYRNSDDGYKAREIAADFVLLLTLGVPVATLSGMWMMTNGYGLASFGVAFFVGTMTKDIAAAKLGDKVQAIIKILTGGKL